MKTLRLRRSSQTSFVCAVAVQNEGLKILKNERIVVVKCIAQRVGVSAGRNRAAQSVRCGAASLSLVTENTIDRRTPLWLIQRILHNGHVLSYCGKRTGIGVP